MYEVARSMFIKKNLFIFLFLLLVIAGVILFTSPEDDLFVLIIIFLSSAAAYVGGRVFLSPKKALLPVLFIFVFLGLSFTIGFNLFNTLLLLCFIIGLSLL